ncbi:hypothetical protein [Rhodococcus sp. NPDC057529]|uniref:hypothetical protein n=1 Tax=Rhodococcus sp. NPDC057529 TaxID=3346158 RepID=UPI00366B07F3
MSALAESGLSECGRTNMNCMPGFGIFLFLFLLALVTIGMSFTISMSATLAIVLARPRVLHGALWFIAVWIVPFLGAAAWFICERHRAGGSRHGAASGDDGE